MPPVTQSQSHTNTNWETTVLLCHAKHEFKKNHAKIIQKAIIFQSPTQQAYPITLEISYYKKDRKTVLFTISLLKSITQTIANPQK